ncbi:MAG: hypothetical protein AVDCRST_MAG88-3479 [uncultured Thermomicrobiales bacterium]|uniref:Uncharacterized protein n=1 Tax=uncultured Thermomicrobiales bacterium TaxID=1645740 RepID=A0A6J4VQJ3_9BACT|nr:MAG: hypothetical protein AVDCRST_MAG88-3479 [uncultured Thermomicrobiales bacterium]
MRNRGVLDPALSIRHLGKERNTHGEVHAAVTPPSYPFLHRSRASSRQQPIRAGIRGDTTPGRDIIPALCDDAKARLQ